ncbi:MAG: S41 family peptidase [Aquificaceae bacterium]|nr:S41 family peptidase [Aquificaceae bacterium]
MGLPLLLIVLLVNLAYGAEYCSKEELLLRISGILEKHYLWWDKVKGATWKDEKELIEHLRKIGDRWTSITKRDEDRLWYSSSKMVGLGIRWDEKGYVLKVFPGSPAEKHGIKEGDLLVSIQGETDKNLWRKIIREAEKGETLKLELVRDGVFIRLEVVKGEFFVPAVEENRIIELDNRKVGYIKLSNFTQPALEGFREAMENFKEKNISVLVIDLRDNGGGLISVAKGMADILLSGEGVMFYLDGRAGNMGVYLFKNRNGFKKPIVVLVNKNTASAAELFTVLLKRYAGAVVVGENTAGKYVGSNIFSIDQCNGNVLRLITFEMKLPNGETITTQKGINPDCKLESGEFINQSLQCLSIHGLEVYPAGQP